MRPPKIIPSIIQIMKLSKILSISVDAVLFLGLSGEYFLSSTLQYCQPIITPKKYAKEYHLTPSGPI